MNDKLCRQLMSYTPAQLMAAYVTIMNFGPDGGEYRIIDKRLFYIQGKYRGKWYRLSASAHFDRITYRIAKKIAHHHPRGIGTFELVAHIDEALRRKDEQTHRIRRRVHAGAVTGGA